MPNTVSRLRLNWVDAKGHYAHTAFFTSSPTANDQSNLASSLIQSIKPLTNAAYNGGMGGLQIPQNPALLGTNAVFGSVEDKARFTFVGQDGSLHRYEIPAPVEAIFMADGETVDLTNAQVLAFVQVILNAALAPAFVCGRDGVGISFFGSGIRVRRKIRRRATAFTKSPNLTIPEE